MNDNNSDKSSKKEMILEEYNNSIFSFKGRINRKSFFIRHIISFLFCFISLKLCEQILYVGYSSLDTDLLYNLGMIIGYLLFFFSFSAHVANTIKRTNDINKKDLDNYILYPYIIIFFVLAYNGLEFALDWKLLISITIDVLVFLYLMAQSSFQSDVLHEARMLDYVVSLYDKSYNLLPFPKEITSVVTYIFSVLAGLIIYCFLVFILILTLPVGIFIKIKEKIH